MSLDTTTEAEHRSSYEVHSKFLHDYVAHYLKDRWLAEDIVQEAFLRYQEVSRWGVIDHPRAYLTKITRNLLVDHWRRIPIRERTQRMADIGEMLAAAEHEVPWYEDVAPNLESALECLPWKQRQIVQQHYLQGQPYAKVAEELNMNVAAVKVASMRARRKLRTLLENLAERSES